MGISTGGARGAPKSDINVTPLVDVVLVLLIIFLVTMPILMRDIPFEVPKKAEENTPPELLPDVQVVIECKADGRVLMNGDEIARTDLASKVRERLDRKREKTVFVDFDDAVRYGDAVAIMDTCKGAGATTVALKMKEANPAGTPTPAGTPAPAPQTP